MRLRSVLPLPLGDGIRERVDSFDIDDEAKPVMAERWRHTATATTGSDCRLLPPEIERVARF